MTTKEVYTVAEVAAIFEVHKETVKLWLGGKQSIKMNGTKVSGVWQITHAEVVRYANALYGGSE